MKRRIAHCITSLYPRPWRDRYGEEFEELLLNESGSLRSLLNVARSALAEHILPAHPFPEPQPLPSLRLMMRKPSAVVPLAMSIAAIAVIVAQIAVIGIVRQTDEGAAAHLWQLLMVGQMPMLLFFAIKWLPRAPRQTLCVLAIQAAAIVVSMTPVFLLNW